MKKKKSSNYSGIIFLILILIGMPLLEPYLKSNDNSSLIILFIIIFGLGSFLNIIGNRKSILQIGGEVVQDNNVTKVVQDNNVTKVVQDNNEPRKGDSGMIAVGAFIAFGVGIIIYGIVDSINRYSS